MKYEGMVILYGVGFVIVSLTIYLIAKAKNSRKAKAEESKMESISAIKGGESIKYPSSIEVKMTGTFPSTNPKWNIGATSVDEVKSSHIEKIKKIKKKQAPMNDYLVEEDKSLLRRVETRDGDFLTSMLVAEVTDSALLGTIVGGDPLGAMVGDMINTDDNDSHSSFDHDSSYYETSFDNDSSSSSDYSSSDSSDYSSSDSSSSDW